MPAEACHAYRKVKEFFEFLEKELTGYFRKSDPKFIREILDQIQKTLGLIEVGLDHVIKRLPEICQTLIAALGFAGLYFAVSTVKQVVWITFLIGGAYQSRYCAGEIGLLPDKVDVAAATVTALAMWLPGMSTWGAAAGTVLVTTPVGVIAAVPLFVGCGAYLGWHFGRRVVKRSSPPLVACDG